MRILWGGNYQISVWFLSGMFPTQNLRDFASWTSLKTWNQKLALALIHNSFAVWISPLTQWIGNTAVADWPRSTHHYMPLNAQEQYHSKQGYAGGAMGKCLVCVSIFKKKTMGTTTVWLAVGQQMALLLLCGQKGDPDVWTAIRAPHSE